MMAEANQGQNQGQGGPPEKVMPSKSNKFPSMMSVNEYGKYQNVVKEEKKTKKTQEHKPNVYGYTFSPLLSEELIQDMKRTQGSFFVGVNISNLLKLLIRSILLF
jgi:hypothetical protein